MYHFIILILLSRQVRLQTMPVPELGKQPRYTGAVDCVVKTVKLEGVRGLYKGR